VGSVRFNAQRQSWFIDFISATGERIRQTIAKKGEDGRRLAPKTSDSYRGLVHLHLFPAFGEMRLGSVTRADVERYLAKQTHLSARTVAYALQLLKAILADAVDHGKLTENVAAKVKAPVRPDRHEEMQILIPETFRRLLDVAEAPWRTLYLVAVRTGLRRGELLALKWADLNLSQQFLDVKQSLGRIRDGDRYVVREAPLKTRKSRRRVGLSADVVEALLAHPAGDDPDRDYVFRSQTGGPIDPDVVGRAFKRHLTLAKLREMRFHDLRHTFASFEIAAGVHPKTLQAELGHASITVTMDRYGHLMPTALEEATALREAFIQGNRKATAAAGERQESLEPAR
jgi:integrase